MSEVQWCIKCRKELEGTTSLSMFGLGTGTGPYCNNPKCVRYGLVTAVVLKPQSEAPEDAKPNVPENS